MLCPEVWNFKAPNSNFKLEKGDLNQTQPFNKINSFYYNHLVSVVLPDTIKVPPKLPESLTKDCDYYKVTNISINELIADTFLNSFIKKGNLTALSINTRIDCDDCVCVTPSKKLILSLTKETYQTLGLEGKLSHFCQNTKGRYIVTLDLLDSKFTPRNKFYDKAKLCLQKLQNYSLILTWEPPEEDICPSSIAKYFNDLNYNIKLCQPTYVPRTTYSVKVPVLNFNEIDVDEAYDFTEWLGMIALGISTENDESNNFISTYETPEPKEEIGQIKILEWRGLFTSLQIQNLCEQLWNVIETEEKPWVSIYVQGFSDCPVNWRENEHHFYVNGDNGYTLIMCPGICMLAIMSTRISDQNRIETSTSK